MSPARRQIIVFAVFDITFIDERLKVRALFDTVWRVEINHLNAARHSFFDQQRIHHQQRVARNQTVRPIMTMFIKLDSFGKRQIRLVGLKKRRLKVRFFFRLAPNGFDNRAWVNPFVNVKRDGRNIKARVFRLSRPLQLRVKMRVVGIRLFPAALIGFGCNQSNRRIIHPVFVGVCILFNRLCRCRSSSSCHNFILREKLKEADRRLHTTLILPII